jgi:hypothetical protein
MSFTKRLAEIWRDYVTEGNPATGAHNPVKADFRAWGLAVENAVNQGVVTLWVPANRMVPVSGVAQSNINFESSGVILPVLSFDKTTQEFAVFSFAPPAHWDLGLLTAQFYWAHPSTTTNFGVRWSIGASTFGNDDALTAVHTQGAVTDTGGTTSDLYISPEVTVNPNNTEAAGDLLALYASRVATHGDDTLDVDAYLIGMKLSFTT